MVREKYRYLVFHVSGVSSKHISIPASEVHRAIQAQTHLLTDWEYALTVPKMKIAEYWPANRIGILKVLLTGARTTDKLFNNISEINGCSCRISHLKTSGIIRKAKVWVISNANKF